MARGWRQGRFTPKHPEKYIGDVTKIRFLSSWELSTHKFLDNNPNVINWSSEEIPIKYFHPFKKRPARYYPDYWVKFKNKQGDIVQEIWEVKPLKQTKPPARKTKRNLYEQATYAVNITKWRAAQQFCDKYSIGFRLVTERNLFK